MSGSCGIVLEPTSTGPPNGRGGVGLLLVLQVPPKFCLALHALLHVLVSRPQPPPQNHGQVRQAVEALKATGARPSLMAEGYATLADMCFASNQIEEAAAVVRHAMSSAEQARSVVVVFVRGVHDAFRVQGAHEVRDGVSWG
jgi:hypothetical protein